MPEPDPQRVSIDIGEGHQWFPWLTYAAERHLAATPLDRALFGDTTPKMSIRMGGEAVTFTLDGIDEITNSPTLGASVRTHWRATETQ